MSSKVCDEITWMSARFYYLVLVPYTVEIYHYAYVSFQTGRASHSKPYFTYNIFYLILYISLLESFYRTVALSINVPQFVSCLRYGKCHHPEVRPAARLVWLMLVKCAVVGLFCQLIGPVRYSSGFNFSNQLYGIVAGILPVKLFRNQESGIRNSLFFNTTRWISNETIHIQQKRMRCFNHTSNIHITGLSEQNVRALIHSRAILI